MTESSVLSALQTNDEIEDIEFKLVQSAIKLRYGHCFEFYAQSSLKRRLLHHVGKLELNCLTDIIGPIIRDEAFFESLLNTVSVPVTEMFRDPEFFKALREKIIPLLETYPRVNIWHAGCATGEEVYSMAIMLEEEGIADKCKIFATDFNGQTLDKARTGIFALEKMKLYTENYYRAGGKSSFSDYYDAHDNNIKMVERLTKNVTFARHNLATDNVFGQFNLILCRNVLIYFGRQLQDRVFSLFHDSMAPLGYLCLGSHESIDYSKSRQQFKTIIERSKIYRKHG